jgi:hypothetical protein
LAARIELRVPRPFVSRREDMVISLSEDTHDWPN